MKIVKTYSFKGGENFVKENYPSELQEVISAIEHLDAISEIVDMEKTYE